jgi:hypothetical protein
LTTKAPMAPSNLKCGSPINSRKHHVFHGDDPRSLCGGYLFFGEKYDTDIETFGKGRDDCKKCGERARKHLGVDVRTVKLEKVKVEVDEIRKLAWACSKLHAAITLGLKAERGSPVHIEAEEALKPFQEELAVMRLRVFEEAKKKDQTEGKPAP